MTTQTAHDLARVLAMAGWSVRMYYGWVDGAYAQNLHADTGPLDEPGPPAPGRTNIIAEFVDDNYVRGWIATWQTCISPRTCTHASTWVPAEG